MYVKHIFFSSQSPSWPELVWAYPKVWSVLAVVGEEEESPHLACAWSAAPSWSQGEGGGRRRHQAAHGDGSRGVALRWNNGRLVKAQWESYLENSTKKCANIRKENLRIWAPLNCARSQCKELLVLSAVCHCSQHEDRATMSGLLITQCNKNVWIFGNISMFNTGIFPNGYGGSVLHP